MTLELTEKERIEVAVEYCLTQAEKLENIKTIPGSPRYYHNIILTDHLQKIFGILTLNEGK